MTTPPPGPEDRLIVRRLLRLAQAKSDSFADHLHPHWVAEAWRRIGLQAGGEGARVPAARHGALLFRTYGLAWPSLAQLRQPVHRICLLGRAGIHRVLAACALHGRRDSVRLCVSRDVSKRLVALLGAPAYEALLAGAAPSAKTGDVPAPTALTAMQIDAPQLAAQGHAVLCGQGRWVSREALAITRLALAPEPPHVGGAPKPVAIPVDGLGDDPIDYLSHYFPELAWLFGSDMDRALSACRTGSSVPRTSRA